MKYVDFMFFLMIVVGCGVTVKGKDGNEYTIEPAKDQPKEESPADEPDTKPSQSTTGSKTPSQNKTKTVCNSALPPGVMDIAIQRDGHFYETNAAIILEAKAMFSSDEDGGQRIMYSDGARMWVRVPELIHSVEGRGSDQASVCLTIGNVNCSYIWGAKVYVLDQCDFGVQPKDILGAKFFSLEVHNTDMAHDVTVRAEIPVVSVVR